MNYHQHVTVRRKPTKCCEFNCRTCIFNPYSYDVYTISEGGKQRLCHIGIRLALVVFEAEKQKP